MLVDTSVWVDHLRDKDEQLVSLLKRNQVLMHPMIRGELACGCLHNRDQILNLLNNLPRISEATHDEALYCLERHKLMGKGIGFVDLHLLASTFLAKNTLLWTRDRRLHKLSQALNLCWEPSF
ncbi:MAG: type II toxin-antitoxin system VapC family toxin [Methylococcales bacterium]|nr:type II toxin-antitoxin system VapC family toxin [Methylococcales bacterium]